MQTLTGIIIGLILFGCMVEVDPEIAFLREKQKTIREAQDACRVDLATHVPDTPPKRLYDSAMARKGHFKTEGEAR